MPHTTLVSTAQLAARLEDPAWVVFDCRHDLARPAAGEAAWAQAHIPGAAFLHLDRDLAGPLTGTNGRHPLPHPRTFANKLSAAGVDEHSQVVAYDDAGGIYAARLWWMMRWLGHDAAAVLDGGWTRWIAEQRSTSSAPPTRPPRVFVPKPRPLHVDAGFVLANLQGSVQGSATQVVDARAADRFRGENETLDPVAGHIPGAINRFFRDNLDAGGNFRPAAELRAAFEGLLVGRDPAQVVHQCGSGVTACHNLLAMEIAGLTGSRLYPGSWSEWCADPGRPIAMGDEKGARGDEKGARDDSGA